MNSIITKPQETEPNYGASRAWIAKLRLAYIRKGDKTILDEMRFKGPLRVQRPFYPEDGQCHTYLLHPPGGMVSGDHIDIKVDASYGAGSFVTTPSAGKIYAADSANVVQRQDIALNVSGGSTLEFLPQENIVFDGANATLNTQIEIDEASQLISWDILSFGRPYGDRPFTSGSIRQQITLNVGGRLVLHEGFKTDEALNILKSTVGLMGHTNMGSMFICCPAKLDQYDQWLDQLREHLPFNEHLKTSATLRDGLIVVRVLGDDIEQVRNLFISLWQRVRKQILNVEPVMPRIWLT